MDYLDKIKEEQNDVCHSALVCIKPFFVKVFYREQAEVYLACSSFRVFVVWSQTSVGPQYWIGPG